MNCIILSLAPIFLKDKVFYCGENITAIIFLLPHRARIHEEKSIQAILSKIGYENKEVPLLLSTNRVHPFQLVDIVSLNRSLRSSGCAPRSSQPRYLCLFSVQDILLWLYRVLQGKELRGRWHDILHFLVEFICIAQSVVCSDKRRMEPVGFRGWRSLLEW